MVVESSSDAGAIWHNIKRCKIVAIAENQKMCSLVYFTMQWNRHKSQIYTCMHIQRLMRKSGTNLKNTVTIWCIFMGSKSAKGFGILLNEYSYYNLPSYSKIRHAIKISNVNCYQIAQKWCDENNTMDKHSIQSTHFPKQHFPLHCSLSIT